MKSLTALLFAVSLLVPLTAGAQIKSSTSATAETGGNSADEGGSVETGNASASTYTKVEGGSEGNSVEVKTEVNGEVHEETYTNVNEVKVEAKATSAGTQTNIEVVPNDASTTAASSSVEALVDADVEVGLASTIVAKVSLWFGAFLGLFLWN